MKNQTQIESRVDFLFENYSSVREEILFRIKQRDDFLKLQLLAQAILLALSQGIEFNVIRATKPYPNALALSAAISLVIACIYYVEDNIIGYLSKYIGAISEAERNLRSETTIIDNWDISEPLREYTKTTLPLRFVAQFVAFILIPAILTIYRFMGYNQNQFINSFEFYLNVVIYVFIIVVVFKGLKVRKTTGQKSSFSIVRDIGKGVDDQNNNKLANK